MTYANNCGDDCSVMPLKMTTDLTTEKKNLNFPVF